MRVQPLLLRSLVLMLGVTLASCAGADDPPRVPTELVCDAGGGQTQRCTLELLASVGYTITLTSRSCDAINDQIEITSPNPNVLTTDACREPVGTVWNYATPTFPACTEIDILFNSDQFANAPGARVRLGSEYPTWVVEFEDGGDTDFNDVVLTVSAVPATPDQGTCG